MRLFFIIAIVALWTTFSQAKSNYPRGVEDCTSMEVWDVGMAMCMPLPMAGMPMSMLMVHGYAFGVDVNEDGPRGRHELASPNMVMVDLGTNLGNDHYLNLDFMGTAEKWTIPLDGYPELLQIGESKENGQPFIDAQHPHSSPVMGLTLSDTISFHRNQDHLKIFFAPRGESTDGPVAFMHRLTGIVNPDAPLGHHIGQDVGHISSTVVGGSLKISDTRFEFSTFSGHEPQPTQVDLPIYMPNSYAFRLIEEFSPGLMAMASIASVNNVEDDETSISTKIRASASLYSHRPLMSGWEIYNTLIYGLITHYDDAANLNSFAEEFLIAGAQPRIWGRLEILQRTPGELEVPVTGDGTTPYWVTALTLGYSHAIVQDWHDVEVDVGGSVTHDFLPDEFKTAYGGDPWAAKLFLQFGGMGMWML